MGIQSSRGTRLYSLEALMNIIRDPDNLGERLCTVLPASIKEAAVCAANLRDSMYMIMKLTRV